MATSTDPRRPADDMWALVRRQHYVLARVQLLALGFTHAAIRHWIASGRLHPLFRGVYAVGRPELTRKGLWMAAVLACGDRAVLSHESAAALWGRLGLVNPERLRKVLDGRRRKHGARGLAKTLDRRTFRLTASDLERLFIPITQKAGLPMPETKRVLNGFEVDFYWPALGLVVETDGLRYHRTPAEQARDRLRDQAHTAPASPACASPTSRSRSSRSTWSAPFGS